MEKKGYAAGDGFNFTFDKTFGQHILKNPLVVKNLVDKTAIKSSDVVLEIGPGTGNLTQMLCEKAKKVIAVEIDPRMASEVSKRMKKLGYGHKFELIHGDAMKVDFPFFDV